MLVYLFLRLKLVFDSLPTAHLYRCFNRVSIVIISLVMPMYIILVAGLITGILPLSVTAIIFSVLVLLMLIYSQVFQCPPLFFAEYMYRLSMFHPLIRFWHSVLSDGSFKSMRWPTGILSWLLYVVFQHVGVAYGAFLLRLFWLFYEPRNVPYATPHFINARDEWVCRFVHSFHTDDDKVCVFPTALLLFVCPICLYMSMSTCTVQDYPHCFSVHHGINNDDGNDGECWICRRKWHYADSILSRFDWHQHRRFGMS